MLGIACSVHIQKECIHFPFLYGFHFRKCFRFWHLASTQIWQILVANHTTNGNINMFLRIADKNMFLRHFADLIVGNLKQKKKKSQNKIRSYDYENSKCTSNSMFRRHISMKLLCLRWFLKSNYSALRLHCILKSTRFAKMVLFPFYFICAVRCIFFLHSCSLF